MATTTTTTAPAAAGVTIADKLEMSLDDLTKLHKKEKREKFLAEKKKRQEAKKTEAAAKGAVTPAGGKKTPVQQKQNKTPAAGTPASQKAKQQNSGKKPGAPAAAANGAPSADKAPIITGTPVIVGNLKEDLDLEELKEIFQTVGALKSAEKLKFNGKSHAVKLVYKLKADAERAVKEFNGRLLDGQPMKVTLGRKRIQLGESKPSSNSGQGGSSQQPSSQPNKRQRKSSA